MWLLTQVPEWHLELERLRKVSEERGREFLCKLKALQLKDGNPPTVSSTWHKIARQTYRK